MHHQLDPQQKHKLRAEEMQRFDWLICQSTSKFVARQVASLMKNEQQSAKICCRSLLLATAFFKPQQMFFVARQVNHAR